MDLQFPFRSLSSFTRARKQTKRFVPSATCVSRRTLSDRFSKGHLILFTKAGSVSLTILLFQFSGPGLCAFSKRDGQDGSGHSRHVSREGHARPVLERGFGVHGDFKGGGRESQRELYCDLTEKFRFLLLQQVR